MYKMTQEEEGYCLTCGCYFDEDCQCEDICDDCNCGACGSRKEYTGQQHC